MSQPSFQVFSMSPTPSPSFARRIRAVMSQQGIVSAVLAKRAELTPSLLSRLITGTESTRREPQLEHVLALARGLEISPAELVAGTEAEHVLGQWIPREEFEKEVQTRLQAQTQCLELRTDLAGHRSELKSLAGELDQTSQEAAKASQREVEARKEQAKLRSERDAAVARLSVALQERDQSWELARRNYDAWAEAQTWILHLKRQVDEAKGAAWISGLVGAGVGAILANAAADPQKGRL